MRSHWSKHSFLLLEIIHLEKLLMSIFPTFCIAQNIEKVLSIIHRILSSLQKGFFEQHIGFHTQKFTIWQSVYLFSVNLENACFCCCICYSLIRSFNAKLAFRVKKYSEFMCVRVLSGFTLLCLTFLLRKLILWQKMLGFPSKN